MPSETFTSDTDWTVPADITRVQIEVSGEKGPAPEFDSSTDGGNGGRVVGELDVSPGDTLYLRFPTDGGSAPPTEFEARGGHSADVRYGGTTLNDRVAVAAGGGGEGQGDDSSIAAGGAGGPDTGQDGGAGAGGGGQTSGGAGGSGSGENGQDGSFGQGGDAGTDTSPEPGPSGGGGGGGWYGGGGGAAVQSFGTGPTAGGGGGGSNYVGGLDSVAANERGTSTTREITLTYTPAPTNLSVDTVRYRSADLSWGAVSGADSYNVYRDGTQVGTTTTTSFTDTGLSPETSYSWEVATVSSGSESGKSNTATDTTGGSAPSNVAVSESATDVTLTWTDTNGDEDGYEIHRAQSSGVDTSGAPLATTAANAESYTDTNPAEGRDYWYRVVAVRNDERGVDSAERGITVPLPAPTGLTVDAVRDTDADLSWTTNTADADAHRVYVKPDDGRTGMSFDGSASDYIGGISPPDTDFQNGFTVAQTAVLDAEVQYQTSWGYNVGGTWWVEFTRDRTTTTGASWTFATESGDNPEVNSGVVLNAGDVTNLIGTYDGATAKIYLDGVEEGSNSISGTFLFPEEHYIGSYSAGSNVHPGNIFFTAIWNRALSASEASAVASGDLPVNGLVGYWPLDLNLSGVTPDVSGYGNDGTVNGPTLTGPPLTDATGALSGSATSGTPSGLLNGQQYKSYLHAETADATVRDQ